MAKQKFDREAVIEQSKELFWHQGYNSCSIQDVVKATGLKPGSIYNSFKNKETLYSEALEHYTNNRIKRMRTLIESASTIPEGFCLFLQDLVHQTTQENYHSCFLIKTQFEITIEQSSLHNQAVEGLEKVEKVLREYLSCEYGEDLGKVRATSVMLHMNGIRVYGYREHGEEKMLLALKESLPWLPWNSHIIF
jgi:AcrR family transcriptional regulator